MNKVVKVLKEKAVNGNGIEGLDGVFERADKVKKLLTKQILEDKKVMN